MLAVQHYMLLSTGIYFGLFNDLFSTVYLRKVSSKLQNFVLSRFASHRHSYPYTKVSFYLFLFLPFLLDMLSLPTIHCPVTLRGQAMP